MLIKKIGIIKKSNVENLDILVNETKSFFLKKGAEVAFEQDVESLDNNIPNLQEPLDLIVVLGGDGTFLSATRVVLKSHYDIPIVGVNLGKIGFLTEISIDTMFYNLEKIFNNDFAIEERMIINVNFEPNSNNQQNYSVFNDVVINKGALAKIIGIDTYIESHSKKQFVSTFYADGLIVATPSGSTAYSLAAGGPIVYPELDSFILTPIAPHTLSNRPIVLPDNVTIHLQLHEDIDRVFLTLDGQMGFRLNKGDKITLNKSNRKIKLITDKNKNYFDILRVKLGWEERKITVLNYDKKRKD
jgi:NAD+ kinase